MLFIVGLVTLGILFLSWKLYSKKNTTPIISITLLPGLTTLWILWTFFSSLTQITAGSSGVGVLFQSVQKDTYLEGIQFVNPFLNIEKMSIRRQAIEFGSASEKHNGDKVVSLSSNNVPLDIDVTYAFQLNPKYAWWVYQHMGPDGTYQESLITQAGRSATRAAVAMFTSDEATTSKRDALTTEMEKQFSRHLVDDIVRQGLPEEDAKQVFVVLPVQLRKALPPEKVLNSIAEKAAAEQDLQRQVTLTNIAEQEAQRRANEGVGVKKLFGELPKGFTPEQISLVVKALADKTKADAMLKAVETGKVSVMVMDGNTSSSIPVK